MTGLPNALNEYCFNVSLVAGTAIKILIFYTIYKIYLMVGKRLSAQNNLISSSGKPSDFIVLGV